MKTKSPNRQTAYEHNSHSTESNKEVKDHAWAIAIRRMIKQRYAFLGLQYDDGFLFRGMSKGFLDALLNNRFWHYDGEDRGNHFEKELNVLLVSQDFSDAYTVSKIWEEGLDPCIAIFKSDVFNKALIDKNAAMMATAEPGVVFKYPFLCRPLTLSEIEYIVVSRQLASGLTDNNKCEKYEKLFPVFHHLQQENKVIQVDINGLAFERTAIEKEIKESLYQMKIQGAKTIESFLKPV